MLYQLRHDATEAALAYHRYLELAPTAADAPIVRDYLQQLEPAPAVPVAAPAGTH